MDFDDLLYGFRHNKADLNSLRNNQQSTIIEETKDSPSFVCGEVEKVLHQEDRNSLPSDFEKYEENLHEYEEVYIENTEDHFKTHSTLEMKQRESNDGCLNYERLPTYGFSHLYVGDVDITF